MRGAARAWASACGIAGALLFAAPAEAGHIVAPPGGYPPGAIVISQSARTLYLVLDGAKAIAYPVAVARRGMEWSGAAHVAAQICRAGLVASELGPARPPGPAGRHSGRRAEQSDGARALKLDRDEIAIHGTTRAMRASIGSAASYGCIRMLNEDVIDLFGRVAVGAPVTMAP